MIDSRTFHVHSHAAKAFSVMHELRLQEQLCDIIISVSGAKFHAHKVVLAGFSPYLRAMFTNGMMESGRDTVDIHGIEAETMDLLLDFMYTCSIVISVENVQQVLQGASLLGLTSLRNMCAHFLQSRLTPSNCLGIHQFADMYACTELESVAREFIFQNFLLVSHTEEFFELSEDQLIGLLKSDKLHVTSENQVFEAACQWLRYDPQSRQQNACRILQNIRLALLDLPFLENVVLKSEFFRTCPQCQLLISNAIRTKQDQSQLERITPRAQPPCIYVIGGRNSEQCQLSSMERYDFLTNEWFTMQCMNTARTAVGAASVDGLLYAVGGECAMAKNQDDTLYLRCTECYDPVLKQWFNKSDMSKARSFVAVAAVGGYLYAIGGEDRQISYSTVERFDPKTNTWTEVPSMKGKRSGAGVTVCDGKIYVAGGYDKILHTDRASMECFDPDTQEWTFTAEMEKARSGLALVALDHFIYAFGGRFRPTDQYFDLVERFNTVTRQWSTIQSMQKPRAWAGVAVFDNKIYVCGGFDGQHRLNDAEVYDPDMDQWTYISSMIIPRAGCAAAVV
ncbi:hypothetical protein C0Q70_07334 [Pomacea canaliculata]|uniref:BTB domain-containing protein n=1 Tax=Pomacea canaliculata TaxID=400727 RepID=A0A2T7PER7_POMCA|nr:kelch-like protein 3 [Pomacea canaliculata]XP_025089463.1 kelch-like protein 3 [Pomacea canaliculata]XP_025089464.1 kelch-like protein 3 [Pomacea canaliculata]XP_025089465.1 kelch-like protein 3 [Pomacea canaliculata]XP_025089466.1 kelch-like protein 3 [Pomacea canaliculata]XP_025089467.1 kelch-like protein 3 [Pomacea canaliculata]XP_025089468.1 kelch-like protein 3 [Pomacea canaliculata]XP_025089469.1 kelch-like protein 3 [Pomacea canaliculata]XP_025089470.1 kelch-like protein 3 [Pomace